MTHAPLRPIIPTVTRRRMGYGARNTHQSKDALTSTAQCEPIHTAQHHLI